MTSGEEDLLFTEQKYKLKRPNRLTVYRKVNENFSGEITWWYHGQAQLSGNTLTWEDGTTLKVKKGRTTVTTIMAQPLQSLLV